MVSRIAAPRSRRRGHDVPDPAPALDVEPVGRLVEEQHVRVTQQRARDVEPALLPAGELPDPGGALAEEVQLVEHLVDAARSDWSGWPAASSSRLTVRSPENPLACRRTPVLRRTASRSRHGSRPRIRISPPSAGGQALEELDRGGLAGAVGAEESGDGAAAYVEVDPAHGLERLASGAVGAPDAAAADGQVGGLLCGHGSRLLRRGSWAAVASVMSRDGRCTGPW